MPLQIIIGIVLAFVLTFFFGILVGMKVSEDIKNEWKKLCFDLKGRKTNIYKY